MLQGFATFRCDVCDRTITIDKRTPREVVIEQFSVPNLRRFVAAYTESISAWEHPVVCSDECHGVANRDGLDGWETTPGDEVREDGLTFVEYPWA